MARRAYGSGGLRQVKGKWEAKSRDAAGVQRTKMLGPIPGTPGGLTRKQAEAKQRAWLDELARRPVVVESLSFAEAADRRIEHVRDRLGRKPTTVQDYRIIRERLVAGLPAALSAVKRDHVEAYIAAQRRAGLSAKTISNHLAFGHSVFAFAVKREWAVVNPFGQVDRPRDVAEPADVRWLDAAELDAAIRHVPDDDLGQVERALYLTAAMTGLRQGELLALRWSDVDFVAGVVRVRRTYTRGAFGAPKSRRSSRAVPMAPRVGGALDRLFQASAFQDDTDLVFGHPLLGTVLDASKVRKRFAAAVRAARVREITFHGLRHTFGTRMAAAGAPLRSIQEWMGHADYKTTLIYADYAPDPSGGAALAERAFATPTNLPTNLGDLSRAGER